MMSRHAIPAISVLAALLAHADHQTTGERPPSTLIAVPVI
jgi:hypothetical protein